MLPIIELEKVDVFPMFHNRDLGVAPLGAPREKTRNDTMEQQSWAYRSTVWGQCVRQRPCGDMAGVQGGTGLARKPRES